MSSAVAIYVPKEEIANFCRRNHIIRLSLFGSVLRDDLRSDSDIDVLVEFEPGHVPGFIRLYQMEEELSALLGNRKVDLFTAKSINIRIRERVLTDAKKEYLVKSDGKTKTNYTQV